MNRAYRSRQHNFFDELVTILVSLETLSVTADVYKGEAGDSIPEDGSLGLGGVTVPIDFKFNPTPVLREIIENRWPTEIILEEKPKGSEMPAKVAHVLSSTGIRGVTSLITQGAFIRYFEKIRPKIESKYGDDPIGWPAVWNFGRVVRNAFGHGGRINFRNPNAPSVTWKSLTYSYADNGREIMYQDVAQVEIIVLMEEM